MRNVPECKKLVLRNVAKRVPHHVKFTSVQNTEIESTYLIVGVCKTQHFPFTGIWTTPTWWNLAVSWRWKGVQGHCFQWCSHDEALSYRWVKDSRSLCYPCGKRVRVYGLQGLVDLSILCSGRFGPRHRTLKLRRFTVKHRRHENLPAYTTIQTIMWIQKIVKKKYRITLTYKM